MRPSLYAPVEGSHWEPWPGKVSIPRRELNQRNRRTVPIWTGEENIEVHALCFGAYDDRESVKWDCVNGFRDMKPPLDLGWR